ncbi:MAG: hypothetical protein ACFFC7_07615 [Candidatus Hermodarchaeota archaeon]
MSVLTVNKIEIEESKLEKISRKIKNELKDNKEVIISNCTLKKGIAAGLRRGKIVIKGSAGDYVGTLNSGAKIIIEGDVGNFVGDNMIDGEIVVKGNAGYCAAPYCYGGKVVILGSCGDFSGTMNKGATILVQQDAGNDIGVYMLAGNIILLENAGERLGNFLISGRIFIRGKWKSLGHNTKITELTSDDIVFLQQFLSNYKINVNPENFTKIIPKTDKPFYSRK